MHVSYDLKWLHTNIGQQFLKNLSLGAGDKSQQLRELCFSRGSEFYSQHHMTSNDILKHKFRGNLFPLVDAVVLGVNMVHRQVGKASMYLK